MGSAVKDFYLVHEYKVCWAKEWNCILKKSFWIIREYTQGVFWYSYFDAPKAATLENQSLQRKTGGG